MKHIQVQVPLNLAPIFPGVQCPLCGALAVIFVQIEKQTPNGPVKEMSMLGGTAACPICGEKTPVETGESPYVQVGERGDADSSSLTEMGDSVSEPK